MLPWCKKTIRRPENPADRQAAQEDLTKKKIQQTNKQKWNKERESSYVEIKLKIGGKADRTATDYMNG